MKIVRASINNLEILQKLNEKVFIDNQRYDNDLLMDWSLTEPGKKYFMNLLKNDRSFCLIAEEDGKPIGYIACAPKDFGYRKSRYLEIENMGVVPEYQSKGIGTALIDKVKEWAKDQGYQRLIVNSYFDNKRAINFYKRSGLNEIDVSLEVKL